MEINPCKICRKEPKVLTDKNDFLIFCKEGCERGFEDYLENKADVISAWNDQNPTGERHA